VLGSIGDRLGDLIAGDVEKPLVDHDAIGDVRRVAEAGTLGWHLLSSFRKVLGGLVPSREPALTRGLPLYRRPTREALNENRVTN
jgi:hypothetical protein